MKHTQHAIYIDAGPFKYGQTEHAGRMMCAQCRTFIKWASYEEVDVYEKYVMQQQSKPCYGDEEPLTHEMFNKMYYKWAGQYINIKKLQPEYDINETPDDRIWLMVKYNEKDTAKQLGACWDRIAKCWYTMIDSEKALDLLEYMTEDDLYRLAKRYELV
jgi:hypothetical protein